MMKLILCALFATAVIAAPEEVRGIWGTVAKDLAKEAAKTAIANEVCNRFMNVSTCAVYWKGNCVGDLENGVMCSCSNGVTGPFCEDAGLPGLEKSKCEKKKEFYDRVLGEDSPRIQVILDMMNSSWIPLVNCTPEGYFAPKQCFQKLSIHDNYTETYCKCVNGKGDVLSDVKTYPGHDSCTVATDRLNGLISKLGKREAEELGPLIAQFNGSQ